MISKLLNRITDEDSAATAVEYAIISAIVGVALIGTLITFRQEIANMLNRAAQAIGAA
jgi:Flp pilus assembly pilin Flp